MTIGLLKYNELSSSFRGLIISIAAYFIIFSVGPVVIGKGLIYYIIQLICAISVLLFGYKEISLNRLHKINTWAITLIEIYIFWQIVQLVRGLFTDLSLNGIAHLFIYPRNMIYYLSPLLCSIAINSRRLDFFFKICLVAVGISLFWVFIYRDVLLVTNHTEISDYAKEAHLVIYNYFALAALPFYSVMAMGFLIIYNKWPNKKKQIIIYLSIFVALFIMLWLGRRAASARMIFIIFLIFILKIKKNFIWLFISSIVFVLCFVLINNHLDEMLSYFPILSGRFFDDTRSWAEEEFFRDMRGDFGSYLFGRGSCGTYFSPTYGYRDVIETGYLDIILHSGIVGLILYVSILFYSFWVGFFDSNNRLINAMALYLLAQIIFLYPTTPIGLDLSTYSVWLCVACCINRRKQNPIKFGGNLNITPLQSYQYKIKK